MRMRRKKHLKSRLDSVSSYILPIDNSILDSRKCLEFPSFLSFYEIFSSNREVHLEIGCGKGAFITKKALYNKDVNFIAVEMLENIIVQAAEKAQKENLSNVRFLNTGAEYLLRYFKENSVSVIYLNFSPPYPKSVYENRRLTNSNLISSYKHILKESGIIYQKTDDKEFFDYSVASFKDAGFNVVDLTDLGIDNDVITEYENKFLAQGKKIYKLKASLI